LLTTAALEVAVRDRHQFVVERIQFRHPHLDLSNDAILPVPLDPVADREWFVLDDEHTGDEVSDEVLCGEPDRERDRTTQGCERGEYGTETCYRRGDRDCEHSRHDDGHTHSESDECLVEAPTMQAFLYCPDRDGSPDPVDDEEHDCEGQDRRYRVDECRDVLLEVDRWSLLQR